MATPHIDAQPSDFASTVLMPGDPLRAQYIAETYLEDVRQVNTVRHMLGFTGLYEGEPVSVMGSGMGIPSISIYAKELYTEFGVCNIVRVGSCGAIHPDLQLRDVVVGMGACTDAGVNRTRFQGNDFAAIADYDLLRETMEIARDRAIPVRAGNLFSAVCAVSDIIATGESLSPVERQTTFDSMIALALASVKQFPKD